MRNVAKINLELEHCSDCPYCREIHEELFCQHDLSTPGIEVGDGEMIPDFCPFVLLRLQNALKVIYDSSSTSIPKKFIAQVERKQKDEDPNPKFFMDHGWEHIRRTIVIGKKFLENCAEYGLSSPNSIQKEKMLFEIAAYLHDVGLADTFRHHAIHSADIAKKYLSGPKIDIDIEDACVIVHAVYNHSKGEETQTLVDAALVLADKLDVTQKRVVRPNSEVTSELLKVQATNFSIYGKNGQARGAELHYDTDPEFDYLKLREWPKAVSVPYRVTTDFLKLPEFKFTINDKQVDIKEIIS